MQVWFSLCCNFLALLATSVKTNGNLRYCRVDQQLFFCPLCCNQPLLANRSPLLVRGACFPCYNQCSRIGDTEIQLACCINGHALTRNCICVYFGRDPINHCYTRNILFTARSPELTLSRHRPSQFNSDFGYASELPQGYRWTGRELRSIADWAAFPLFASCPVRSSLADHCNARQRQNRRRRLQSIPVHRSSEIDLRISTSLKANQLAS